MDEFFNDAKRGKYTFKKLKFSTTPIAYNLNNENSTIH